MITPLHQRTQNRRREAVHARIVPPIANKRNAIREIINQNWTVTSSTCVGINLKRNMKAGIPSVKNHSPCIHQSCPNRFLMLNRYPKGKEKKEIKCIENIQVKSTLRVRGCFSPCLDVAAEEVWLKPADLLIRLPQFAGLVDIDLASLLRICLSEFFANPKSLDASLENASLAAKIRGTCQAERRSEVEFSLVEQVSVGVIREVENLALPVSLENFAVALGESIEGW